MSLLTKQTVDSVGSSYGRAIFLRTKLTCLDDGGPDSRLKRLFTRYFRQGAKKMFMCHQEIALMVRKYSRVLDGCLEHRFSKS